MQIFIDKWCIFITDLYARQYEKIFVWLLPLELWRSTFLLGRTTGAFFRKWSRFTDGGRLGFDGRGPTLGSGFLSGTTSDTLLWLGSGGLNAEATFMSLCCWSILRWRSSPVNLILLGTWTSLGGILGLSWAPKRWEGGGLGKTPGGPEWNISGTIWVFRGKTGLGGTTEVLFRRTPLVRDSGSTPTVRGLMVDPPPEAAISNWAWNLARRALTSTFSSCKEIKSILSSETIQWPWCASS